MCITFYAFRACKLVDVLYIRKSPYVETIETAVNNVNHYQYNEFMPQ